MTKEILADRSSDSTKAQRRVVYCALIVSNCAGCSSTIEKDEFLILRQHVPVCLTCGGLDHLVYLPSGDAALTRRALRRSTLSAEVKRFSRARKRNERQGVLVENAALKAAQQECSLDATSRAARREREAKRRVSEDRAFETCVAEEIRLLFPCCPPHVANEIAQHTTERGSGRVGRTASGRALDPDALTAAVIAKVRHDRTNYDELLARNWERSEAREQVREEVDKVLEQWRGPKKGREGRLNSDTPERPEK
jgi:hypothetical protein